MDALAWLQTAAPVGDEVAHLDRIFALRCHDRKVYLPCRPEVLLALPEEHRAGTWHVIRADYPNDAFAHVRHVESGEPCRAPGQRRGGCAVEDVKEGTWSDACTILMKLNPDLKASEYSDVHVPRRWSFPDSVGY